MLALETQLFIFCRSNHSSFMNVSFSVTFTRLGYIILCINFKFSFTSDLHKTVIVFCHTQYNSRGLFDRASSSWNKVKCQLDVTRLFYWCILSSSCFGYIRPSSGALDVELQHMVFCRLCLQCGPKTRCRKPYAATQHLMLLMMDVCTRNMSS